jgi:hypothetical protein
VISYLCHNVYQYTDKCLKFKICFYNLTVIIKLKYPANSRSYLFNNHFIPGPHLISLPVLKKTSTFVRLKTFTYSTNA